MNPDTVQRYKDHLNVKIKFIIKDLFKDRVKGKRYENGNTSPLKEDAGNVEDFDIYFAQELDIEMELSNKRSHDFAQELISKAMLTQNEGTNEDSDFMKVSTFLQAIDKPMKQISEETNIPYYYVRNLVKGGQEYLKQAIRE